MSLVPRFALNSLRNAWLANTGRLDATAAYPIDCCYLVTWRCNLRCVYCYESAGPRGAQPSPELDTAGVRRALAGIREATDGLVISGGEPTTRDDLVEILGCAHELGFEELILNTNLVRLPDLSFLDHVDQVLVGLDAFTEESFVGLTCGTPAQFRQQQENLQTLLALRKERRFDVCFSSVVCADRLEEAERLLDWCTEHEILVAFSPHVASLVADPRLKQSERYRAFAERLYRVRRAGGPLMGTSSYYRALRDFDPFRCIPMANLTVEPDGRMRWPCGEAQPAGPSFAEGKPWKQMLEEVRQSHGGLPTQCEGKCHFGCRLALSALVNRPWEFPGEAAHLWKYKRHSR